MKLKTIVTLTILTYALTGGQVSGILLPSTTWPAGTLTSSSVCPSKTVNYITHRLSQQCLKTGWSSASAAHTTGIEVISSTVGTQLGPISTISSGERSTKHIGSHHSSSGHANDSTIPTNISVTDTSATVVGSNTAQIPLASPSDSPGPKLEVDTEVDAALDNSNFLSFEEWKKQNLARAGQSAESLGDRRTPSSGSERRNRPGNINNALDSLGEDTEIDLDFGGFRSASTAADSRRNSVQVAEAQRAVMGGAATSKGGVDVEGTQRPRARNKDAGKTCKERFNYASFDCAANVLKTNPEAKGSSSILVENKDSYMLNTCAADNKFFIVELCDDILVDTIALANFEFFSSIFRTFRVSVSDRYPVKMDRWKELGTFEARNSRDLQVFLIENPLIWARYLRVELLTHFGNEFYCPISLLRVHGTTMMEEFRHQVETTKGEEDPEEELVGEMGSVARKSPEIDTVKPEDTFGQTNLTVNDTNQVPVSHENASYKYGNGTKVIDSNNMGNTSSLAITPKHTSSQYTNVKALVPSTILSGSSRLPLPQHVSNPATSSMPETLSLQSLLKPSSASAVVLHASSPSSQFSAQVSATESTDMAFVSSDSSSKTSEVPDVTRTSSESPISRVSNGQQPDAEKIVPSPIQPPQPNPTTQESFFKTIHKRLQLLEANATLSLQYIEEQSRILRDAFNKVEKRQLAKTTAFLENLNSTVLAELQGFRQQYDQIWQSTVIELENQREQSQKEILAVSARLSMLADEVVFQKRMTIIQSGLLLLCLGLIIFSRGAANNYLELPLVQNMMPKSSSSLRVSLESPSISPSSTRPNSAAQNGRPFGMSSESNDSHSSNGNAHSAQHLTLEFSPPTPTSSSTEFSGSEDRTERSASPDPSSPLALPRLVTGRPINTQTESSPTTPTVTRTLQSHLERRHGEDSRCTDQLSAERFSEGPGLRQEVSSSQSSHLGDDSLLFG